MTNGAKVSVSDEGKGPKGEEFVMQQYSTQLDPSQVPRHHEFVDRPCNVLGR